MKLLSALISSFVAIAYSQEYPTLPTPSADGTLQLAVMAKSKQVWEGFGATLLVYDQFPALSSKSASFRKSFSETLFKAADIRAVRTWDYSANYGTHPLMKDAVQYGGVQEVLVCALGCYYQDGRGCQTSPVTPEYHADYWTRMVNNLKNAGVPVTAIGFKNKANTTGSGSGWRTDPNQVASYVKAMRSRLDATGNAGIKLIAPEVVEWSPYPSVVDADKYDFRPGDDTLYLKALASDSVASKMLYGFASQTYGMGVNAAMERIVSRYGKKYWQTIGSQFSKDFSQNDHYVTTAGPLTAAAVLGDMNHGVSLWFYWAIDNLYKSDLTGYSPKWHFMKTIADATDPGMIVREVKAHRPIPTTTDFPFDMSKYSEVYASAGRNPDGSMGVALVDMRGVTGSIWQVKDNTTGIGARQVDLVIQELIGKTDADFQVTRIRSNNISTSNATVTVRNGVVRLSVSPLELVVLRSQPGLVLTDPPGGASGPVVIDTLRIPQTGILEAESASQLFGLSVMDGNRVGGSGAGDWILWDNVFFDRSYQSLAISYGVPAEYTGNGMEIRLDSPSGTLIGSMTTQATGTWSTMRTDTIQINQIPTGLHKLYLVFRKNTGTINDWVGDVDKVQWIMDSTTPLKQKAKLERRGDSRSIVHPSKGIRIQVDETLYKINGKID